MKNNNNSYTVKKDFFQKKFKNIQKILQKN